MRRALSIAALAACVPISTSTRNVETVERSERVREPPGDPTIVGATRLETDSIVVEARLEHRCRETIVEHVRTTCQVTREANKLVLGLEIGLGITLGAGAGALIWDSLAEERVLFTDAAPEVERNVGIATAAIGGLLLIAAVIDGRRAADRVEDLGQEARRRPGGTAKVCDEKPGAQLAIAATNARGEAILGTTDRSGRLVLPLASVPGVLVEGAKPPADARIVARTERGAIELGIVNLASTRAAHASAARRDAETANVPERWDDLAARFPEEHGAEATRRARELRLAAARASLAAGDIAASRAMLTTLQQRHAQDPEVLAVAADLDKREADAAREALWRGASEAVALLGPTAPVEQFATATAAIAAAEASGPDARGAELRARVDAARAQRVAAALAQAKRAGRDIAAARAAIAIAEALAPADAGVQKARRALDATELRVVTQEARARAAAKDWEAAATLYARALELRPTDRSLQRERDRVERKRVPPAVAGGAVSTAPHPGTPVPPAPAPTTATAPEPAATPTATTAPTTGTTPTAATAPTTGTTPTAATAPTTGTAPPTATAPTSTAPTSTTPPEATHPASPPARPSATAVSARPPRPAAPPAVTADATPPALEQPQLRATPRARANATFTLGARTPRAPIEWLQLPKGCIGHFAGTTIDVDCRDAQLRLVRDDSSVSAACEADSCERCTQLQERLVPRGKLDKATARCEEATP